MTTLAGGGIFMIGPDHLGEKFKLALGNDAVAMHTTAMLLKDQNYYQDAYTLLVKAAHGSYAPSQYELANLYYAGLGVEENIEKAFYYYGQAAKQGDADAANNFADMYLNGEATDVDEVLALKWFRIAAEQGVVEAMFTLGMMYEQGLGTEADVHQAYVYYEASAQGGYDDAQYRVGMIYLEGLLEKQPNEEIAIAWFEQAAEQFHLDAIFNLGYVYEQKQIGATAISYYKQAALLGDYQAKCQLVTIYSEGLLVPQDQQEADKWKQMASRQLDESQHN